MKFFDLELGGLASMAINYLNKQGDCWKHEFTNGSTPAQCGNKDHVGESHILYVSSREICMNQTEATLRWKSNCTKK